MDMILVVDDNQDTCGILSDILTSEGYAVNTANDVKTALTGLGKEAADLVLLDKKLPDMDGLKALEEMMRLDAGMPVIMLTGYGDVKSAVMAMKLGAFDYVTKPFDEKELRLVVEKALEMRRLRRSQAAGDKDISAMGGSPRIKQTLKQAGIVAPTNMTVILQGESGVGKELIARFIHENSLRKDKPFIAVDCGTLQETLAETELFGHEKGAFTGADGRKDGQFILAHGGTLFMDEITNLPVSIQGKLLRVLQERKVHRLGGKKDVEIDVRIIVAANVNVEEEARRSRFRHDLYQRLNEFTIEIPPLRERMADIPVLTRRFIVEANAELDKKVKGIEGEAMKRLMDYNWPGNVRELKNVVRKAVLQTGSGMSITQVFPDEPVKPPQGRGLQTQTDLSFKSSTRKAAMEIERALIKDALEQSKNNKSRAAKLLKIDRMTLYSKIKSLGLS
ncbi:MAG: sigma-54-dependent Fis family transcriptional regulator [Deltaproteobacteria bacterium]|nr:sigma-54-dependent Fis family transcriptional regulator [Deltaproteobacteria bacterium]